MSAIHAHKCSQHLLCRGPSGGLPASPPDSPAQQPVIVPSRRPSTGGWGSDEREELWRQQQRRQQQQQRNALRENGDMAPQQLGRAAVSETLLPRPQSGQVWPVLCRASDSATNATAASAQPMQACPRHVQHIESMASQAAPGAGCPMLPTLLKLSAAACSRVQLCIVPAW